MCYPSPVWTLLRPRRPLVQDKRVTTLRSHTPVVGCVGSERRYPAYRRNTSWRAAGPDRLLSRGCPFTPCPPPCPLACPRPCPLQKTGVLDSPGQGSLLVTHAFGPRGPTRRPRGFGPQGPTHRGPEITRSAPSRGVIPPPVGPRGPSLGREFGPRGPNSRAQQNSRSGSATVVRKARSGTLPVPPWSLKPRPRVSGYTARGTANMLLTLTTTARPATDLVGYLLHKNPARPQTFDLSFGKEHVFYPEVRDDRCRGLGALRAPRTALARPRVRVWRIGSRERAGRLAPVARGLLIHPDP